LKKNATIVIVVVSGGSSAFQFVIQIGSI